MHRPYPTIQNQWHKTDWWLDANEAVVLGFADAVLSPEHSVHKRKSRRTRRASKKRVTGKE